MNFDEKIIFTVLFSVFSILVWFVDTKADNSLPKLLSAGLWHASGLFFKRDGSLRKYTKFGFTGFFWGCILLVWLYA